MDTIGMCRRCGLVTSLCDVPGQLFFIFKKKSKSKSVRFFAKLYPRVLGLVATPDPRVIFIILIITINLG